ncbi:protein TRIGALACTOSYLDIACYLGLYCEROL 5, chloroplastic-like [Phragmites australis]|uniref:protein TRIGALACTOSYLDIACYLGLYCEROL 5, chloroplastic-like n=1 Tax=Phragmites australis TaxID=29695 RepID=UPI002D7878DE|nr:protein TRIGALACTOSYLDIACYLGLYCEROL 5, chloroplastic-like [Phragmites australis]
MGGGGRRVPRWGLPASRSRVLGKLGPSFGIGAGCGVGVGVGIIGGAGVGPGFPGLRLGFGVGVGCGIGIGFGYGFGKGVAYDESGRYSNIGRSNWTSSGLPSEDQIDILVDELIENSKKLIKATSKEIDKWRRA